jgi:photosystem II stability/assembly factor-like uncharacterized protein
MKHGSSVHRLSFLIIAVLVLAVGVRAQEKPAAPEGTLSPEWAKILKWRCIGPAGMGGRITALSVYEVDPNIYWVGTAGGGLLKTVNAGTTFDYQFDHEGSASVGAVCVAPSDPNIVWVGTGENNPRNSVSCGDGVYKSTDGGKTWKNMGLRDTFQIGAIRVHPKDPNVVYVGALGRLWGHNKERGLFKTTDGGQTWQKVLFVDDKTGVIDIAMKPDDPETLLVAMWERQRDGYDSHPGAQPMEDGYDSYDPIRKWGAGGGIYKTTDGGKTFKKLTAGLPTNPTGRIGLDFYRKNPNTVFAIVDCQKIAMGTPPSRVFMGILGEDAPGGAKLTMVTSNAPAAKAGLKEGDVITAVDGKPIANYTALTEAIRARKAGDRLKVTFTRDGKSQDATVTLEERPQETAPQGGGGQGRGGGPGRALFGLLGAAAQDEEGGGIRLMRLFPEGAAEDADLREGDVIKEVEKKPVADTQQLLEALRGRKSGSKIALTILREGKTQQADLKIGEPGGMFGGGRAASRTRPYSSGLGGQQPNVQDQQGPNSFEYGGIYRSDDAGETWKRINSLNPRPMYFSVLRVDPNDDKNLYVCGVSMFRSADGGKTFTGNASDRVHADQHALWIDPRDGRHMIVGCDGGFYVTYDRTEHWDHLNQMAIGQFYHVAVDSRQPYHVIGGLQDNGIWSGPSMGLTGTGPINEDWIFVGGGDGFQCQVDPTNPDLVYFESQDGAIGRRNLRTGERGSIRPRAARGVRYRFNWNTPYILSAHNPGILYSAGNYVFRSVKKGDDMRVISPEITRTPYGSGTTLAESPRNPDVLWAGTDDGNLWVTRDGGAKWSNVAEKVGLPGPRWVATIEASRFVEGRAYVAFDAHRSDDDEPYLYVTEDYGQTWRSLRANLPKGPTRCLREDIKNPDLLFCGTEFGAWVSLNRGSYWTSLNGNLPTVAVFDFALHPTAGEMVAATHGRSLWVLDITPLRQMTASAIGASAYLYEPNTVIRWRSEPAKGSPYGSGHRHYFGENPPRGAQIYYSLNQKAASVKLTILDYAGNPVRELPAKAEPGLNVVAWDLARAPRRPAGAAGGRAGRPGGAGAGPGGAPAGQAGAPPPAETETPPPPTGGFRGFGAGQSVPAGTYRVVLTVDGKDYTQPLRIENDPTLPPGTVITEPQEEPGEEEREKPRRIDD